MGTAGQALPAATKYMAAVRSLLDTVAASEEGSIAAAVEVVVAALQTDHLVYVFGTGHSHMLAEECHYRAGGLAAVCPILSTALMLHEGAVASTRMERTSGVAELTLSRYDTHPGDVIFIISNSGANAVPVEMALAAKERGLFVIAIVAKEYAATVKAGPSGRKLADVADLVIDNHGIPGDALVEIGGGLRSGPSSTVVGAFLLNAIFTESAARLAQSGATPPVFVSANMSGAAEHNAALYARYRTRNPHL